MNTWENLGDGELVNSNNFGLEEKQIIEKSGYDAAVK